ncbi:hypothetical protein DVR12_05535 [Chitinophaga silvatica]|uniref:Uncharacterized protein n=1 Tax=Chitinophaga silvatica TaxID=2282649 RepID=A0A3E1YDM9_9BACT|nr:hypothetical protein [Chitinophaga silvatica]RFS24665.1 hypothetical protein DVR12_05535 [Chitinophaga silvatica]
MIVYLLTGYLILASIIIPLAFAGDLIDRNIKKEISRILKEHDCQLVSINDTYKSFVFKSQLSELDWRNFVWFKPRSRPYKEVTFVRGDNDEVITSLVFVRCLFFKPYEIVFDKISK